jgi:hypothetical protein
MSSDTDTLGIGDSLGAAFSLTNGQTVNVTYNLSSTPDRVSPFYGYDLILFSGGGLNSDSIVYAAGGLGAINSSFSYTASGNGCFYFFSQVTNNVITPSELATTSISFSLSPNIVPSPVSIGYGAPTLYTGKYGCTECDPAAESLP